MSARSLSSARAFVALSLGVVVTECANTGFRIRSSEFIETRRVGFAVQNYAVFEKRIGLLGPAAEFSVAVATEDYGDRALVCCAGRL